ncbi:putative protein TPRXL [Hyalella azteca]|uniref:Uncharacterized protein n=1 Tax=Hyalella azteca TaxID=294128 RepID=A0A979FRF4_HYAAZ|nr:putative protein TPRXL [Hyalella azteca]
MDIARSQLDIDMTRAQALRDSEQPSIGCTSSQPVRSQKGERFVTEGCARSDRASQFGGIAVSLASSFTIRHAPGASKCAKSPNFGAINATQTPVRKASSRLMLISELEHSSKKTDDRHSSYAEASNTATHSEGTVAVTSSPASTVLENPSRVVYHRGPRAVSPTSAPQQSAASVSTTSAPQQSAVSVSTTSAPQQIAASVSTTSASQQSAASVSTTSAPQQSAASVSTTSAPQQSAASVSTTSAPQQSAALVSHTSDTQRSHVIALPTSASARSAATAPPELDPTQKSVKVVRVTRSRDAADTLTAKSQMDLHGTTSQSLRWEFVDPGGGARQASRVEPGRQEARATRMTSPPQKTWRSGESHSSTLSKGSCFQIDVPRVLSYVTLPI